MGLRPKIFLLWHFYPRPPRGGRPYEAENLNPGMANFYPRPPRGGRLGPLRAGSTTGQFLSTPSARRATFTGSFLLSLIAISIHALREEGDQILAKSQAAADEFLSTPSARRATNHHSIYGVVNQFLSTPSARRATFHEGTCQGFQLISIHALREEGDLTLRLFISIIDNFYPRPPRGGRPEALGIEFTPT